MTDPESRNKTLALTRRRLILSLAGSFGLGGILTAAGLRALDRFGSPFTPFWATLDQVVPEAGVNTAVSFGESLQRLIAAGALDPVKLGTYYMTNRGLPDWVKHLFAAPSTAPIVLSFETAPFLLNLLWPLGLATKTKFNVSNPINGPTLGSFASTGGWQFAKNGDGSAYFNRVAAIQLTDDQDRRVFELAGKIFRPCCDNSTYFQDCNHGSALLGLLELATAQDATVEELYRIALAANSYWFPDQYAKTAFYFTLFEGRPWNDVPAELILGPQFSSQSGWQNNVNERIRLASFMSRTGKMEQGACAI